jgi:uncharacterized protein (TIRG00374 family)
MPRYVRTLVAVALGIGLVALFLREVDPATVLAAIGHAQPVWLGLALASMFLNLALRALRWRYLLAPIGSTSFANAFRATAVGFAARGVLPSAAGELVRPYFLSRHEAISATGAFATVVLERLLDMLTVLVLLATFVFGFGRHLTAANPGAYAAITWAGAVAGIAASAALVLLFVMAGNPARLNRLFLRVERRLPARLAAMVAGVADRFVEGLAAIRSPARLLVALAWSVPLWLCIGFGIWGVAMAFRLDVPFSGSFLLIAFLTIGITIPTPGAVGGFHEAFRIGATQFFSAPQTEAVGAAIVLHAISVGSSMFLGAIFVAQDGLNLAGVRELVSDAQSSRVA